jgi:uncharacterized protein YjbJ (UPF0337 family)
MILTLVIITTVVILLRHIRGKISIIKYKKINKTEAGKNWNGQKGKLKKRFAVLTDNDLMFVKGRKEEMFGRLQIKLGKTKEEWNNIIASL